MLHKRKYKEHPKHDSNNILTLSYAKKNNNKNNKSTIVWVIIKH